jgi:hypothetical protein
MKYIERTNDRQVIDPKWLRTEHRITLKSGGHRFIDLTSADGAIVSGRCWAWVSVGGRWAWHDVYFISYSARTVTLARAADGVCLFIALRAVGEIRWARDLRPPHPTRLDLERAIYARRGT